VIEPYECRVHAADVPRFLRGYAASCGSPLDLDAVLDALLDTDVGHGRWLVLPVNGPLTLELAGERGTGSVEVRARPTGPRADEAIAQLRPLGAVLSR